MGLVIAWMECEVMSKRNLNRTLKLSLKRIQEVQVKRVVAQVCQTDHFALHLGIQVDSMLEWDS
ncbi:uncharacterized protein G2W53_014470 [Senna tora]|uniref:Uncharacterized protein n=1 Tax=Senna tora TaxID=362788 RepID=A0A834WTM3_9FABA|nr:uncharacterized protein G2W53_014470 [Senna tora]